VNTVPVINTSSPTFSARTFSSVKGKLNLIITIQSCAIKVATIGGGEKPKIITAASTR
jgi:hypothetical protein